MANRKSFFNGMAALAILACVSAAGLTGCAAEQRRLEEERRTMAFDLYTEGEALEARGDNNAALEKYMGAMEMSPRPAFVYKTGHIYRLLGDSERAMMYFDKALSMAPDYKLAEAERELARLELVEAGILERTAPVEVADATPAKAPVVASEDKNAVPPEPPSAIESSTSTKTEEPAPAPEPAKKAPAMASEDTKAVPPQPPASTSSVKQSEPVEPPAPKETVIERHSNDGAPPAATEPEKEITRITHDEAAKPEPAKAPQATPATKTSPPSDSSSRKAPAAIDDEKEVNHAPTEQESEPETEEKPSISRKLLEDVTLMGEPKPEGTLESLDEGQVRAVLFPELGMQGEADIDAERQRAVEATKAERWGDASRMWRRVVAFRPDDVEARLNLAKSLLRTSRVRQSLEVYSQAAEVAPANEEILFQWANALVEADELERAEGKYNEALAINPDSVSAANNLGALYLRRTDWARAESHFRLMCEQFPEFAPARINLALAAEKQGAGIGELEGLLQEYIRLGGDRKSEAEEWLRDLRKQGDARP